MSNEKKKKRGIFRNSPFSSWRNSSITSECIPHSRTSASSEAPPSSSDAPPPASAPPRLSIVHQMVPRKSRFRQCDVCEKFFFLDVVRRSHSEDVYACNVCGIRVHKGCLDKLKGDCKITTQYVGGILENAVIQSNKKQWEKPTVVTSSTPSTSTATSPPVTEPNRNLHVNPTISMTASTLDDMTMYSETEDHDLETLLMTWEDVTIKLSDVQVKGRIGDGRFGTVHFAEYHGDAAVKFVNMNYVKEEAQRIDVFTQEIVTAYKNSRHDHIALFYGYAADPATNTYAIVTNFYQHKTLYHRIHESAEEFEQSWSFHISLQICQAMSYLHKKKILHRDLRSKNILLDNPNRVVVTDFALMKLERLQVPQRCYTLAIPNHWIDYLAPEIAGSLVSNEKRNMILDTELQFTAESDIYSFGTIFFELLVRKMPTGCDSWEQKLYAKMCGQKAALQRLDSQLQRIDQKLYDLLLECWNQNPANRPSFTQIVKRITKMIPRKESNKQKRRSTAHENPLF